VPVGFLKLLREENQYRAFSFLASYACNG